MIGPKGEVNESEYRTRSKDRQNHCPRMSIYASQANLTGVGSKVGTGVGSGDGRSETVGSCRYQRIKKSRSNKRCATLMRLEALKETALLTRDGAGVGSDVGAPLGIGVGI
jgi:hypothetical protein